MYISIDIGGTNTRLAFSKDLSQIDDIQKTPTPKDLPSLQLLIKNYIDTKPNIKKISLGIAGIIDKSTNMIIYCPHIPSLSSNKASILLPSNFDGESILLENDATLAGLGEATHGAGKEYERVAYITISTGVGGTLIVNKKIQSKKINYEPGHVIMNLDDSFNYKKNLNGSLESYCSGTAFLARLGLDPSTITDQKIWDDYGQLLAIGLYNIILLWQPNCIVLGGSMSKQSDKFMRSMNLELKKRIEYDIPVIKTSELSDENGIIGGLQNLKASL